LILFGETPGFINDVCAKKSGLQENVATERRGGARKILTEHQKQQVKDHINSFPSYGSHYCRMQSTKRFLPQGLTILKMYSMYKTKCEGTPVSLTAYKLIFKKK